MNKKAVFVDTSAIIAHISKREEKHEKAQNVFRVLKQREYHLFISNYIVDEVYAGILNASKLRNPHQKIQLALQTLETMHDEDEYAVLFVDQNIEERARKELLNFDDKLWSITDMTSFLLIQEYKIGYFLSFDSDFRQASHYFGFLDIIPYLA